MFTGALLDPSTQTIKGTWLPPKDCFRMIWIWAAPLGEGRHLQDGHLDAGHSYSQPRRVCRNRRIESRHLDVKNIARRGARARPERSWRNW